MGGGVGIFVAISGDLAGAADIVVVDGFLLDVGRGLLYAVYAFSYVVYVNTVL